MSTVSEARPRYHKLKVADYYRMAEVGILAPDARVELIDGEIIDMVPIGSAHASCVDRLLRVLSGSVGEQAIVRVQNPLRLGDFSEPGPDLMLLKPKEDFYASRHPAADDVLLLIEVSDTSLQYDLGVKIPLYAAHGVGEVWVVDLAGRCLLMHREPAGKAYRRVESSESLATVAPSALPGVTLDLRQLF